jgi:hypothetical protein
MVLQCGAHLFFIAYMQISANFSLIVFWKPATLWEKNSGTSTYFSFPWIVILYQTKFTRYLSENTNTLHRAGENIDKWEFITA